MGRTVTFFDEILEDIDKKLMIAESKPRPSRASDSIKYSQRAFDSLDSEGLRSCLFESGLLAKSEEIIESRYIGFDEKACRFVYGFIWQDNEEPEENDKGEDINYAINKIFIGLNKKGLFCDMTGHPEKSGLHIKTAKSLLKSLGL